MAESLTARTHAPLVIGHRGAPGYRPEHTESSYRLAVQLGVDLVEPDVVVTRDGVLVIRHENEISGTTNVAEFAEFATRRRTKIVDGQRLTGWFTEDFTWDELSRLRCRERIARTRPANTLWNDTEGLLRLSDLLRLLDDLNQQADARVGVVIEIKHAHYFLGLGFDLAALVAAELGAAGWHNRPEQVVFESFEVGVLERLRESNVVGRRVMLTETAGTPADAAAITGLDVVDWPWYRSDAGLDWLAGRVHGISVAKADLFARSRRGVATTNDLVQRAHARELAVFVWTLRPENRFLMPTYRQGSDAVQPGDWKAEWAQILATGVDGVFVDHPDLIAHVPKTSGS